MDINQIKETFVKLQSEDAKKLVQTAIDEGMDPVKVLQEGVIAGLKEVGKKFETEEYFLAELMMAGKLGEACIAIITPHLPENTEKAGGVVVLGAVEGDLHDIGYSLVATQLKLAGYEVHMIGVNVPSMKFIEKSQEVNADIIGMSAFLVTTIPNCAEVVKYLVDMNIRDNFKVIIGGAETSQEKAVSMGCDGQAENAVEAVKLCDRLMGHA